MGAVVVVDELETSIRVRDLAEKISIRLGGPKEFGYPPEVKIVMEVIRWACHFYGEESILPIHNEDNAFVLVKTKLCGN